LVHESVELRLHDGSIDAEAINNWVKIHARFIDFVKDCSLTNLSDRFSGDLKTQFEALTSIVGYDLGEYYKGVMASFGNPLGLQVA
jgi:hypothetical protein